MAPWSSAVRRTGREVNVEGMEILGIGTTGKWAEGRTTGGMGTIFVDEERATSLLAAFKRETRQRYLDKSAERGVAALDASSRASAPAWRGTEPPPERTGLLVVATTGPRGTRGDFLDSYLSRGKTSASATLFSNCGFNIAGAMMARSRKITGPVLTLAGDDPARLLAENAEILFSTGHMDVAFLAVVDGEGAVVLCVRPTAQGFARDALSRAIRALL